MLETIKDSTWIIYAMLMNVVITLIFLLSILMKRVTISITSTSTSTSKPEEDNVKVIEEKELETKVEEEPKIQGLTEDNT